MKDFKIALIVLIALVSLITIFFIVKMPGSEGFTERRVINISNSDKNTYTFIRISVSGMNSDKRVVFVTTNKDANAMPNQESDYIYNGFSPIFYKQQTDSLIIYCQTASPKPLKWNLGFKIVQVELDNRELMRMLDHENYKNEGLKLVE